MLFGLLLLATLGAEPTLQPGVYGELLLARDPATQKLTGHFSSATGEGKFSCIFSFESTAVKDGAVPVESWFPATPKERIKGTLTITAPDAFTLALAEEHGGCSNVQHFADATQPATFTLDTARPWLSLAVVKEKKTRFFASPGDEKPKAAYLVKGDVVGVLERKGPWLSVEFFGNGKSTVGWMKSDVFF